MPPLPYAENAIMALWKWQLEKRDVELPLHSIKAWSSETSTFKIDAIGLLSLLGADELNASIGQLQRRRYTEYLPLLAAFVVSENRLTSRQPGCVIYNLTDNIASTELQGWFTRWITSQSVNNATTVLEWRLQKHHTRAITSLVAPALALVLISPLSVHALLTEDWYDIANSGAIMISIFVRAFLLWQLRDARDKTANATPNPTCPEYVKDVCVIRADGKMVTCKVPASVLQSFTTDCGLEHKISVTIARRLGWLAFGVHICILGMSTFFTQVYTVVLLVLSTWAVSSDLDMDLGRISQEKSRVKFAKRISMMPFNNLWDVKRTDHPKWKEHRGSRLRTNLDRRQVAWARMLLNEKQETMMKRWCLMPGEDHKTWWKDYETWKEELLKEELHTATESDEELPITPSAEVNPLLLSQGRTPLSRPRHRQSSEDWWPDGPWTNPEPENR